MKTLFCVRCGRRLSFNEDEKAKARGFFGKCDHCLLHYQVAEGKDELELKISVNCPEPGGREGEEEGQEVAAR